MSRGGQVSDGLAIEALRSRLAELSGAAAGVEAEARDKECTEMECELAILELFDAAANGSDIREMLLSGKVNIPDAPGYAQLGHELIRRDDFDAAEVAYLLAIELDPASPSLHRSLADVIDASGRSKEAVEILERLAAQAPHDPELHARLGHVLIRSGDLGRAEAALRDAIAIDAAPMRAHCDLADVLAATGRPSEGIAMLQALVAQGVDDSELHARLGRLRQRHPAAQRPSDQPQPARANVNGPERQARPGGANVNDLERHLRLFKDFQPFSGFVGKGFLVDFLGSLTDANFRSMWDVDPGKVGGADVTTSLPDVTWGEGFFEIVDWFEAALEARGTYTMVTLGACYGSQAVGAYLALQRLNPMPCRLVAVEAEPGNFAWLQQHFRDNGIDPQQHWLLNCALSDTNKPVLFPIGESGSGVNNCFSTNEPRSREIYAEQLSKQPQLAEVVYNLILEGKTGIEVAPVPGMDFRTSVVFVSAVTLKDVLAPLETVDLLESDIQQSEIVVFPPAMDVIEAKVKRIHLGTHGASTHAALLQEFADRDFEIIFDYPPNSSHETPWGSFSVNDGIITARNPRLLR